MKTLLNLLTLTLIFIGSSAFAANYWCESDTYLTTRTGNHSDRYDVHSSIAIMGNEIRHVSYLDLPIKYVFEITSTKDGVITGKTKDNATIKLEFIKDKPNHMNVSMWGLPTETFYCKVF